MDSALDSEQLVPALEAILMVASEPVSPQDLADATGCDLAAVQQALQTLVLDYDGALSGPRRGFELRAVDGRYRVYSRSDWAPWVGRFVVGTDTSTLSKAALETLAIVAYRQPVTRAQLARIRGVNVDGVLRTLVSRDLVQEDGVSVTGAHLFRTTTHFLAMVGVDSLEDLPALAPYVPGQDSVETLAAELKDM